MTARSGERWYAPGEVGVAASHELVEGSGT
jgi:hypothetical protein